MKPTDCFWIDMGFVPSRVAFCPSKRAWRRLMKKIGCDDPYPATDGCCTVFERADEHLLIVTIGDSAEKTRSAEQIIGILAHEAAHVWEFAKERMAETSAGSEIDAYAIGYLVSALVAGFNATRGLPAYTETG